MRAVRRTAGLIAALMALTPPLAFAQQLVRRSKPSTGADAYVMIESESLAAKQSFDAVLGASSLTFVGGGVDVVRIWKGAFVRVAVSRAQKTGSRVFVDSTLRTYPLNIPLTITMTPIEAGGGWRLPSLDGKGRVVPYVGAAALWLHYQESSSFADASENTDTIFGGSALFAGVEGNIGHLNVGVEGLLRRVPQGVGAGGVSASFKESDLGGGAVRLRIGASF